MYACLNNFQEEFLKNNRGILKGISVDFSDSTDNATITVVSPTAVYKIVAPLFKTSDGEKIPAVFARVSRESLTGAPRSTEKAYSKDDAMALLRSASKVSVTLMKVGKKSASLTLSVPASFNAETGAHASLVLPASLKFDLSRRHDEPARATSRTAQQISAACMIEASELADLFGEDEV